MEIVQRRPIIFIAHCLGGIILKHVSRYIITDGLDINISQALIQANISHRGHLVEYKWIALSTYGILFLGTPHQGTSAIANPANQLLKIASLSSLTNDVLLKHLTTNSEWLQQQLSFYNSIGADICTKFFYETLPTILHDGHTEIVRTIILCLYKLNIIDFFRLSPKYLQ